MSREKILEILKNLKRGHTHTFSAVPDRVMREVVAEAEAEFNALYAVEYLGKYQIVGKVSK